MRTKKDKTRRRTRGGRPSSFSRNSKKHILMKSNMRLLSQENEYLRNELQKCKNTCGSKPIPIVPLEEMSEQPNSMIERINEQKKRNEENYMNELLAIANASNSK